MKKYRLVDYYEEYGVIGEYDAIWDMLEAAHEWTWETGGECDLIYQIRCEECGKYHKITI